MAGKISDQLEVIKKQIAAGEVSWLARATEDWGGADVVISPVMTEAISDWLASQPLVLSPQETYPRRRAVINAYSKELSWLFVQLGDIFSEKIDHVSKYDFYGMLAQSAQDYLDGCCESPQLGDLLAAVLEASEQFV